MNLQSFIELVIVFTVTIVLGAILIITKDTPNKPEPIPKIEPVSSIPAIHPKLIKPKQYPMLVPYGPIYLKVPITVAGGEWI